MILIQPAVLESGRKSKKMPTSTDPGAANSPIPIPIRYWNDSSIHPPRNPIFRLFTVLFLNSVPNHTTPYLCNTLTASQLSAARPRRIGVNLTISISIEFG